jgi:hypothetical protein
MSPADHATQHGTRRPAPTAYRRLRRVVDNTEQRKRQYIAAVAVFVVVAAAVSIVLAFIPVLTK